MIAGAAVVACVSAVALSMNFMGAENAADGVAPVPAADVRQADAQGALPDREPVAPESAVRIAGNPQTTAPRQAPRPAAETTVPASDDPRWALDVAPSGPTPPLRAALADEVDPEPPGDLPASAAEADRTPPDAPSLDRPAVAGDDAGDSGVVTGAIPFPGEAAGEDAAQPGGIALRSSVTAHVNMRAAPDNDAEVLAIVPQGGEVEVVACDGWCEVVHGGRSGYIYSSFVADADAAPASRP